MKDSHGLGSSRPPPATLSFPSSLLFLSIDKNSLLTQDVGVVSD